MNRASVRGVALGLLTISALYALPGHADNFPSRPVKLISPSAAGSTPDVATRIVADRLEQLWKQQVVIINRPGGGGLIALQALAGTRERDGHALYVANSASLLVLPETQTKLPIDLLPVGFIGESPISIAVTPSLGVNTLADLILLAKKRPGEIFYAGNFRGSVPHLTGEMFRIRSGADFTYVPYSGPAAALGDLIGGRISVIVDGLPGLKGAIEGGVLKPLAIASKTRLPNFPDLPTVAETLPGFVGTGWFVIMAPAGTPDEVVSKINHDLVQVLDDREVKQRFEALGIYLRAMSPQQLAEFIRGEQDTWRPIIKQIELPLQ
jgi:tripartite-type tricarboxylate transporter receptor subunit TctC